MGGPFDRAPFGYAPFDSAQDLRQDLRQDKPGVRGLGRGRRVWRSRNPLRECLSSPETSVCLIFRNRCRPRTIPEPTRDSIPPDPGQVKGRNKSFFRKPLRLIQSSQGSSPCSLLKTSRRTCSRKSGLAATKPPFDCAQDKPGEDGIARIRTCARD